MHNNKSKLKIIITLFVSLVVVLSFPKAEAVYAHNSCVASRDLDKTISHNKASVTNNTLNSCTYTVTLALYDAPLAPDSFGWIEAQTLIGSDTKTLKAGDRVDFAVTDTGKACYRQSDLFEGSTVLSTPIYVNNLATDVYSVGCVTPTIIITPTPTSTPTSTPTPTNTPTPGPTDTPTPGPTNTPTPGPTATPGLVQGTVSSVLAGTGNTGIIYLVVIAGAIFLISGMILKKFNK